MSHFGGLSWKNRVLCSYEFVIQLDSFVEQIYPGVVFKSLICETFILQIIILKSMPCRNYHMFSPITSPWSPGATRLNQVPRGDGAHHIQLQNNSVVVFRPPPHCYVSVTSILMYLTHIFGPYFTPTYKDSGFCLGVFNSSQDNSVFWLNPITPNSAWQLALCNHVSELRSISNTSYTKCDRS